MTSCVRSRRRRPPRLSSSPRACCASTTSPLATRVTRATRNSFYVTLASRVSARAACAHSVARAALHVQCTTASHVQPWRPPPSTHACAVSRCLTSPLPALAYTVPARKKTAIVGSSGSGKSTVLKLIMRAYDPDAGSVSIDGQDISHVDLPSLRQQLGLVPQVPAHSASPWLVCWPAASHVDCCGELSVIQTR
jgi:hypothetical protein